MRENIIILIVAVLAVSLTASAGYPPDYIGDPVVPNGCRNVESWLVDYHDMNPWSSPDPTGAFFLMGTRCVEDGVVVLDFTDFAWRWCSEAPWGTIDDDPICVAWWVGDWRSGRHVLAWDNGVYISGIWGETLGGDLVFHFDALTWNADDAAGRFVQGVFWLDATIFLRDDDRFTRSTYVVRERVTPYGNAVRRSTRRVGQ